MSGCRKHKKKHKFKFPRRRDALTRMVVDIGISYVESLGPFAASDFLRTKNVPENVIHRVIKKQDD